MPHAHRPWHSARRQRGDALLVTVIMLLLMTIGLFAIMRIVKTDSQTTGALGWRTQASQAAEQVLMLTKQQLDEYGDPIRPRRAAWFDQGAGATATTPDTAYWAGCSVNNPGSAPPARACDTLTGVNGAFTVRRAVRFIRGDEPGSCPGDYSADFYRIFIHAEETGGNGSSADLDQVYKLCVR